ncbi:MAG TPA: hypothetical protein VE954_03405, partial [Oligoflexus sp.]|uniref:hypothetical protein n=1 Tax=Oligoflexus sp. TaxID=1971216 RepID=UPI002D4562A9
LALGACQRSKANSKLFNSQTDDIVSGISIDPTVTARMVKKGFPLIRSPYLISNGSFLKVDCADEVKRGDILSRLGFSSTFVDFTVDSQANFAVTGNLNCDPAKRYFYKYVDDTKNRTLYYVVDDNAKSVFVLGCQALVDGFGFAGAHPELDDSGAELIAAKDDAWPIRTINCLKGKDINPDAGKFDDVTLAFSQINLQAGDSVTVPLKVRDLITGDVVSFDYDFATSKPCNKDLVWATLSGQAHDQLIVGSKPTLVPYSCELKIKAKVDGLDAEPLVVEVKAEPKTYDRVWAFPGTTCSSTSQGEVQCWGSYTWNFPARNARVKDFTLGIYYACALYDTNQGQNLACQYSPRVSPALQARQPKGFVRALAGSLNSVCAIVANGEASNRDQMIKCWKADTSASPDDPSLINDYAVHDSTTLSMLSGGSLCFDSAEDVPEKRRIKCLYDTTFNNVIPTPSTEVSKLFNVADINANMGFSLPKGLAGEVLPLDIKRTIGMGCTIYNGKVGCWGWADSPAEQKVAEALGKVATKPGSLRLVGDQICFQTASSDPNPDTVIECWNRSSDKAVKVFNDLGKTRSFDIIKLGNDTIVCKVNGDGTEVSCTNNKVRTQKQLIPEGAYWTKKIKV